MNTINIPPKRQSPPVGFAVIHRRTAATVGSEFKLASESDRANMFYKQLGFVYATHPAVCQIYRDRSNMRSIVDDAQCMFVEVQVLGQRFNIHEALFMTDSVRIVREISAHEWEWRCTGEFTLLGETYHYEKARLHRDNGPAVVSASGLEVWYSHGLRHRVDGPALSNRDFEEWYLHDCLHRNVGAAQWQKSYWHHGQVVPNSGPLQWQLTSVFADAVSSTWNRLPLYLSPLNQQSFFQRHDVIPVAAALHKVTSIRAPPAISDEDECTIADTSLPTTTASSQKRHRGKPTQEPVSVASDLLPPLFKRRPGRPKGSMNKRKREVSPEPVPVVVEPKAIFTELKTRSRAHVMSKECETLQKDGHVRLDERIVLSDSTKAALMKCCDKAIGSKAQIYDTKRKGHPIVITDIPHNVWRDLLPQLRECLPFPEPCVRCAQVIVVPAGVAAQKLHRDNVSRPGLIYNLAIALDNQPLGTRFVTRSHMETISKRKISGEETQQRAKTSDAQLVLFDPHIVHGGGGNIGADERVHRIFIDMVDDTISRADEEALEQRLSCGYGAKGLRQKFADLLVV